MKKAIVSGANGFIGSYVVKELVKNGVEVIALVMGDNNLPDVKTLQLDMANIKDLKKQGITADIFYHFAWQGSAGMDRVDTKLQLQNTQWTIDCLRIAKEIGCTRFVGAGSIMEHETSAAILKQGNKPGLSYIYGAAKQTAHAMCKSVAASIGIDLLWAQITNAYGVGELSPRFINTTIQKIINNEPLKFTSATQNYDFVYITDVAKAFYLIGKSGKPFHYYLIGSGNAKPLRDFIIEMKSTLAPDKEFVFGDIPFSGVSLPLSYFDTSDLCNDTGFSCDISFAEGISKTYEWLKTQDIGNTAAPIPNTTGQSFQVLPTDFDNAKLIKPFFAYDERGYFIKDYSKEFLQQNGLTHELKEVFYTHSHKGVVRAIHFQREKQQAKLVRCVSGRIYDVIVDLRKNSPTFGKWQGFELSEENKDALYIPGGFGHGYIVLEPSIVSYKCNENFYGEYDDGIIWNDSDINIIWSKVEKIILSDKDLKLQSFKSFIERYGGLD